MREKGDWDDSGGGPWLSSFSQRSSWTGDHGKVSLVAGHALETSRCNV